MAARKDGDDAALLAGAAEAAWESLAALPHAADRSCADLWLIPVLREAGERGAAARADGRLLTLGAAVEAALGALRA